MLRSIRIDDPANTWVISDPHFNHRHPAIFERRGVASRDELNEQAIARWNEAVPANGIVFCLGDFCLHDPDGTVTRRILKRLNFRVLHILWGNHTAGVKRLYRETLARTIFKGDANRANAYEVYPVRATVGDRKEVVFVGAGVDLLWEQADGKDLRIVCGHYAHRTWQHSYLGSWMLCGHTHGNDPATANLGDAGIGRILEVTPEVIGRPLSILEIEKIMSNKTIHAIDVAVGDDTVE